MPKSKRRQKTSTPLLMLDGAIITFRAMMTHPVAFIRLVPATVHFARGMRAFRKKEYEHASRLLGKALIACPQNVLAQETVGKCQRKLGQDKKAHDTLRDAVKLKRTLMRRCARGKCGLS